MIEILEQLEESLIENADDSLLSELAQENCRACQGQGFIEDVDYVPYGSTSVPMESTEICDCVWNAELLSVLAIASLIKDNLDKNQVKELVERLV